ncbi:MAG: hypothetical protein HC819_23865 [Cyclobacteriaceae bacterium]|nr:hypothetical protein [Cyclobacteriaceae bacterium]
MEPTKQNEDRDKKQEIKRKILIYNFSSLVKSAKDFLQEIMAIREGTDIEGTVQSIKKDMVFRGPTVWILIASIFIASIGLNAGSIPVVIGAMLISPLMGSYHCNWFICWHKRLGNINAGTKKTLVLPL